jgi:hypothetical protein
MSDARSAVCVYKSARRAFISAAMRRTQATTAKERCATLEAEIRKSVEVLERMESEMSESNLANVRSTFEAKLARARAAKEEVK